MRKGLALIGGVVLAAAAAAIDDGPAFVQRAAAEARVLPLQPVGDRHIEIDGDLDEWELRVDSFAIHQLLDHTVPDFHQSWKQQWADQATDAALIKLLRSDDALYVALQVADNAVVSPADSAQRLNGDVVDMYLDLRPVQGDGPKLGHVKYTEGIYQLVFAPPSPEGQPVCILQPENEVFTDWRSGQKVARIGPFQAASRLVDGGYTVELRLPLSSFPHQPPGDRLRRPIGFEIMIADTDIERPKGQPERMYYSCSGYSGGNNYFKSPATMACSDPGLRSALPFSRLCDNPLRTAPGGAERAGWIVTELAGTVTAADFAAAGIAVAAEPSPPTTYTCPALGLAFHHRRVLTRLPAAAPACVGNRYLPVFPVAGRQMKVDGDLAEWADFPGATTIHQLGCLPYCVTMPDRRDVATVMLMCARDTLFVGMRVQDDSVFNPGQDDQPFAGDCVQLFIDVRDPQAAENPLSHTKYSDGAYQFLLAPPLADGGATAFIQGPQKVRAAGRIDAVCRLQPDGYSLELAIPVSSLLAPSVPGRFEQIFGFEALVTDVDRRGEGDYAPVVHYSWSGSEEEYLQRQPSVFCGADYVPNRLPEIRALTDTSPVQITVDASRQLGSFSGFGGNYLRDESLVHTGGRAGRYAVAAASTHFIADQMQYKWARVNLRLFEWEWRNDDDSPETGNLSRFESTIGQPGYDHATDSGPHYKAQVDSYLSMLKHWQRDDVRLCAYADNLPAWLFPAGKPARTIPPELWPEYAECVGSYLLYAKEQHGVTFDFFALQNARYGHPGFDAAAYPEVLKHFGAYFGSHGLKTKLLLCDTDAPNNFRWYAGMLADQDLLQYIGGVGLATSGSLDAQLATYRLWRDLAAQIARPLLITNFGRPYTSSTTYLFDEVRIWQQMLRELTPYAAMIQQFVSERTSSKWQMVHGREIVEDKVRGLPALQLARLADEPADVLTTQRFWITKQFCELTPVGDAIMTSSDHPQVLVSGFIGQVAEGPVYALHVANSGAARGATLAGLPFELTSLRLVRTTGGESCHDAGDVFVDNGRAEVALPAWSLVTLTSSPR